MPQKIITLPKQLANQIAAGEVVERPLSVVKELVENSLDAGASQIDIFLQNGWIDEILVKDNGAWIAWDELLLSLEKYSTSKITSIDDLYSVMTFGFRWEALASISSVSYFFISSKTAECQSAKRIISEWWDSIKEEIVAHEVGTSIKVSHLFYNTPARLVYLKKPRTEYLKIQDFIQKISLIYPNIWFSLSHNDSQVYNFSPQQGIKSRIYEIYGEQFSENLLNLSHEFSGVRVSGFLTDPKISYKNKSRQLLYVNNRIINSPMIAKAIYDAYNRFIPHGSQPWYILRIEVDPTQVDVNVHPRKMEVRFAQEATIFRSVYHWVKDELERVSLVSSPDFSSTSPHTWILSPLGEKEVIVSPLSSKGEGLGVRGQYYTGSGTKFKNYSPYKNLQSNPSQASINFSKQILWSDTTDRFTHTTASHTTTDVRETPLGKIIGQVHNSYIIVQTLWGIQILDQHALAERVIYEKLSSSSYAPSTQWLLSSVWMHLTTWELEILETHTQDFQNMWFDIEILSRGNIIISAIPDFMNKQNIEKIFQDILGDISNSWSKWLSEVRHKIWAYTACRSAVKFWDSLSIFEISKLLHDAALDYSATCPHGRPVVYDISLEELLGKYER